MTTETGARGALERAHSGGRDDPRDGGSGPLGPLDDVLDPVREALLLVPRFGLLLYRLVRDPRVSRFDRWLFGATLAYLFIPIDLLPDWIPLVGGLDDLVLVAIALDRLLTGTDEAILLEHWEGDPEPIYFLERVLGRMSNALPWWGRRLIRGR